MVLLADLQEGGSLPTHSGDCEQNQFDRLYYGYSSTFRLGSCNARGKKAYCSVCTKQCNLTIFFVLQELAQRKAKVLATLQELQNEVAPITYATEKLKDTDHMKDSKSFISILQKEYDVRF